MRGLVKIVRVVTLVLVPVSAFAQASIAGLVKDTSGAILPGVTVEAASSALIEKTRFGVTDGSGQYRIVDLRPGLYTVTFSLPGFNTVKREAIELTGSFTATVNVDMRVGALEETITVTGETPIVDVQSATRQRVLNREVIDSIPASRVPAGLGVLIPGVVATVQDVGGAGQGAVQATLTAHGSRQDAQKIMQNGISLTTVSGTGNSMAAVPNIGAMQEVAFDYAAVSAELAQGGVRINLIPREGGNTFRGSFYGAFANSSMQGSNYTPELKARGLASPDELKKNWDVNPGFGGPLRTDRLWFFASVRHNGAENYGGLFHNLNENNPNAWLYVPDPSRRSSSDFIWKDAQGRITWQATPKNKLAVTTDFQRSCGCPSVPNGGTLATQAPEAQIQWRFPRQRLVQGDWTSPVTNRLLLEAATIHRFEGYAWQAIAGLNPSLIPVTEQSSGISYRARSATTLANETWSFRYRVAVSYITGAHAFKVGVNDERSSYDRTFFTAPISYRFNNGIPNQITLNATPYSNSGDLGHDFGLYAQDKWTLRRLTVTAGLRYDEYLTSFPDQHIGPALLVPTRDLTFPGRDNLNWKDVSPRLGGSYDLSGNGKTALKVSFNRYLNGLGLVNGLPTIPNPVNTQVLTTTRSWSDTNANFIPDCSLVEPLANGECGALANRNFGNVVPGTTLNPEILRGWGKRDFNWEFSTGIQHELVPRVSIDVSYFRRWYGNFLVTDNLTVGPPDYDVFRITAPVDPRLPGGGGYGISGLYDLNPSKFGVAANNYVTFASDYGKQFEHWNGVDVNVNTRFRNDLLLQGGFSTGRIVTDNCEVAAKVPESLLAAPVLTVANAGTWTPLQYCHQQSPFQTQLKMLGSYTVPKVDVQVGATLQSVLGPLIAANYALSSAVAAQTLGRPLSGNAANLTVNLVAPGSLYGERLNQLDLRFSKILRYGTTKTSFNVELYNALNSSAVLTLNNSYGAWQTPTSVITARFMKIGVQVDF